MNGKNLPTLVISRSIIKVHIDAVLIFAIARYLIHTKNRINSNFNPNLTQGFPH